DLNDAVGGADTGHHGRVVGQGIRALVLLVDGLVPDEFGADAGDHLVAPAQRLLEPRDARADAAYCGAAPVDDDGGDPVLSEQRGDVLHAGARPLIGVVGVGRLGVD